MPRKPKNGTTQSTPPPATDAAHAPVVRLKFTRQLPCRIDEPALITMAEGMAGLFEDLDKVEEERADTMREFKQRIAGIKDRMKELAKGVRSHTEMRDVECVQQLNAAQAIEVVRLDTGEVIETRAADAMDLQEPLDLAQELGPDGRMRDVPGPAPAALSLLDDDLDDPIDDPAAVLGDEKWSTGPNPKPIHPGAA